jgi:MarR family 2-MHQ and catechol resistance regulon transcriptional repressor
VDYSPQSATSSVTHQYRMIHNIYVLLDEGDRRVLRPFGLTLSQYRVLKTLDLEQGKRLTTLSDRLLRAKSTITRIIDQLEQDGLVQRTSDAEDRRAQRVILTHHGAELLAEAQLVHERVLDHRVNEALTPEEQTAFQSLLEKLHDSLVETMDVPDSMIASPDHPAD